LKKPWKTQRLHQKTESASKPSGDFRKQAVTRKIWRRKNNSDNPLRWMPKNNWAQNKQGLTNLKIAWIGRWTIHIGAPCQPEGGLSNNA
jgi:hypothetical protein